MGKLLPGYKKSLIDEILDNVTSNTSFYYAFAANPIAYVGNTPAISSDDYTSSFTNHWQMLFGKKLTNNDIVPVITNITWATNTVYSSYDDRAELSGKNYYVVTSPAINGGNYDVYKCIDNANGAPSTQTPDQVQPSTFQKSDGYKWRYITSISSADYTKFATSDFVPLKANSSIVSGAYTYSGVEVVKIANSGQGYAAYADGKVKSVVNTTVIQVDASSTDNDFYTGSAIYVYNTGSATGQLKNVSKYVSNSSGNWVFMSSAANTTNITSNVTNYKISPRVVWQTDGDVDPAAYAVINTTSNSISTIVVVDTGYGVSWANASISSNSSYGSGAALVPVVPPAGGHGSNPLVELDVKGFAASFKFANTEASSILSNTIYNKIGLIKNPAVLNANTTKGNAWTNSTFSAVLKGTVNPATTFTVGDTLTGATSSAVGTVAFANSTTVYLTGDKYFTDGEFITSSDGQKTATLSITSRGDVYTKDLAPLYIQNIDNVTRSNTQTESFKLIIQV